MTGSGIYWIVLLDDYAGSWGLIFIAIIEGNVIDAFCRKFDVRCSAYHLKECKNLRAFAFFKNFNTFLI